MSKRPAKSTRKKPAAAPSAASGPTAPPPVDVSDGIPDRAAHPSWRRLLWVLVIFAAWMAFLVYVKTAGS